MIRMQSSKSLYSILCSIGSSEGSQVDEWRGQSWGVGGQDAPPRSSSEIFQFGPNIRRWIKTFYNNASTCVQVNGHYSSWFNIGRGVRQGDPLSPYLDLIGAEILSTMIRENSQIEGIKINQKIVLYHSLLMTLHFVWMAVKNHLRKVYRHLRNLLFSLD